MAGCISILMMAGKRQHAMPMATIITNQKFPDMKGLTDYVHSLGLRMGIYSSPGPKTCGGYLGSWQHEDQDAKTYGDWGIDYLKYDWCSYSRGKPAKPNSWMIIKSLTR